MKDYYEHESGTLAPLLSPPPLPQRGTITAFFRIALPPF